MSSLHEEKKLCTTEGFVRNRFTYYGGTWICRVITVMDLHIDFARFICKLYMLYAEYQLYRWDMYDKQDNLSVLLRCHQNDMKYIYKY